MSQENKILARRFVEEFLNTADESVLAELAAPGYVDHDLPSGVTPASRSPRSGPDSPTPSSASKDIIAETDRAVVRYRIEATHTGTLYGMPPTGRRVRLDGISIYRISNGRLAEAWVQYDKAALMEQLH